MRELSASGDINWKRVGNKLTIEISSLDRFSRVSDWVIDHDGVPALAWLALTALWMIKGARSKGASRAYVEHAVAEFQNMLATWVLQGIDTDAVETEQGTERTFVIKPTAQH